jgi:16S rRNA (adenine1518-N6/adenine1519-N6)-dimethyltransferase
MPSRESGAVTAAVRWRSEPKILFDVSAGSFYPAPGVGSSVIQLTLRKTPPFPVKDQALMFKMIRGAFSQRRKTVLNSLSGTLGADKNQLLDVFSRAKVNPAARPEALSLEDFGRMADNF